MESHVLAALLATCAPQVDPATARALVQVESSFNRHAIGVVGGALERQPRSDAEALGTLQRLAADGWDYSVGLAQINRRNFVRLGLTDATALDSCANLSAMQAVLSECFERYRRDAAPQLALRRALSCYYSGNAVTGFRHGYVQRVLDAARSQGVATVAR
jgi:type IV secretion system protein VirB1